MSLRRARGRRALITGGAGFIGSHLAEALIADGYAVTALDDLSTGSEENIAHLDKLELVVGDTANERLVEELVAESDVVFHLAAAVGVKLILAGADRELPDERLGTEAVLERRRAVRHEGADRVDVRGLREGRRGTAARGRRRPARPDRDQTAGPSGLQDA